MQRHQSTEAHYPQSKLTIVGGGIVAALEAYFAHLDAKKNNSQVRVTIYEKNDVLSETTTSNIVPSLTPDEIISVVPRGQELLKKLRHLFSEPGGIRVDDVNVKNAAGDHFIQEVLEYGNDDAAEAERTKTLLELGKKSMELWQDIYDTADDELKKILLDANFNPCHEISKTGEKELHDGYRIDLIYNVDTAKEKAEAMKKDYSDLGYQNCKILTPAEVKKLDPFLTDFVNNHSEADASGEYHWKKDAVALFRPGGCINTNILLPKLHAYLSKVMGKYVNDEGKEKDCFRIKYQRNVQNVAYDVHEDRINGLQFADETIKHNKHHYAKSDYVFSPGESVGTLAKLGFAEPAYAGFAGASLRLSIPVPKEKIEQYKSFNHCMEVHQEGVVLAWQAKFIDNNIFIGVAGTKAFYSDQKPTKDQAFAKNRNLLQLNMINDVLPEFISLALGKNTEGQKLTADDLHILEDKKIAQRWAGRRAVAYDGFPTLGKLYHAGNVISNARCTTHLGSGGVSFGPATVSASRASSEEKQDTFTQKVLAYASSSRSALFNASKATSVASEKQDDVEYRTTYIV